MQQGAAGRRDRPPMADRQAERRCVFCDRPVAAWRPFRIATAELSGFLARLDVVGSAAERFWCPNCGSTDRERHLRLFLDRLGIIETARGGAVLHIAPEARLSEFVQSFGCRIYIKGDLRPGDASVRPIDLENIQFPGGSFDLAICNHVLEHVTDLAAALRELRRVLKPAGRLVCQTPFAARLTRTFEDAALQSAADRLFFYGDEGHRRLFGSDIAGILRQAGFAGRLVPHDEILPGADPERLGVNEKEPFFDFVRSA